MEIVKLSADMVHIQSDESHIYFRNTEIERELIKNYIPEQLLLEIFQTWGDSPTVTVLSEEPNEIQTTGFAQAFFKANQ